MKKLLFPLLSNLENINYYSGSFVSIYNSLKEYYDIVPIGPLIVRKNILHSGLNRLNRYNVYPRRFATMHSWKTIFGYAEQIIPMADRLHYDALFAANTMCLAAVTTNKPKFAFADLSFINALNYEPFASKLHPASEAEALKVDKFCFENHTKVFLASEWARKETIRAYNIPEDRIIAVGRGANLVSGYKEFELPNVVNNRLRSRVKNFLFVGRNWERKGGEDAYKIISYLFHKGINLKLQIVGCNPTQMEILKSPLVEIYPDLNRRIPDDKAKLVELFANAFLFILPTKVEAMGQVFAEAASFGLPSIAYDTGGVSTAIEDYKTGRLFRTTDSIEDVSMVILRLITNHELYKQMSLNAYQKFKHELNWPVIIQRIKSYIDLSID